MILIVKLPVLFTNVPEIELQGSSTFVVLNDTGVSLTLNTTLCALCEILFVFLLLVHDYHDHCILTECWYLELRL